MEEEALEYSGKHPEIMEKYKIASQITNDVMKKVVEACVPGAKIVDVCKLGDSLILEEVAKFFSKSKDMEKGIAFPTCVSPNNIVGHFSPFSDDNTTLQDGDVVKIDLGAHIDGYIACAAHTLVVTSTPDQAVTGKKADVICAAYFASEAALRLFRPGRKNSEITKAINVVAENFGCHVVQGVLSHSMKRFIIDDNAVVISKESPEHQVDEVIFQDYDIFCFDIVMSTGEGKPKEQNLRATVYKRNPEVSFSLRVQASRSTFKEITTKWGTMLFSLRNFQDEKRAKLGITECFKHELVDAYPVLFEKDGEYVAQFKFTAVIKPGETVKLTSHPLPFVQSEFSVQDKEVSDILQLGLKRSNAKKKAKKKKKNTNNNTNNNTTADITPQTDTQQAMDTGK